MYPDEDLGLKLHHFRPEGTVVLTGTVFGDRNGNGIQEADEQSLANRLVIAESEQVIRTYTDQRGRYEFSLQEEKSYSVYPEENACYARFGGTEAYMFTADGNSVERDFAVSIAANTSSLWPRLESFTSIRCGFTELFMVSVINDGCQLQSGEVSLVLHPAATVDTLYDTPSAMGDGVVSWSFTELLPGEHYTVYLDLTLPKEEFVGEEIPMLVYTTTTNTEGNTLRDTFHYTDVLSCAIDPNDKRSWPSRPEASNSNTPNSTRPSPTPSASRIRVTTPPSPSAWKTSSPTISTGRPLDPSPPATITASPYARAATSKYSSPIYCWYIASVQPTGARAPAGLLPGPAAVGPCRATLRRLPPPLSGPAGG